jgi:uncharacterized protein (DUF983 family)
MPNPDAHKLDLSLVMVRGLIGRCPHCGVGHLFARYLKQVEVCPVCGEALGHIRADDGPAWLTIILVGHILAPILLNVVPDSTWPDWVSVLVWTGLAGLLSLVILPRAKGFFIGIIWRNDGPGT